MLSKHMVYSITKAKTNSQLYMMRCIKEAPLSSFPDTEVKWVPIKLALSSVEGPLLENASCSYEASAAVAYFHLRPYSEAIHSCLQGNFQVTVTELQRHNMKDQASDHQNSLAQSNRSKQEHLAPKLSRISDEIRKTNADFIEDPIENDIASKRKSEQAAAAANPANSTLKYGPMTTKDGGDAGKALEQFLDKYPIPLQHKSSATNQAMDDQVHNTEEFSTQTPMKQQVLRVDQTDRPKEKSDERHQASVTQKQAVIQKIPEVIVTETIVHPQPEKDHFTSFQCSAQTQETEMNSCRDEPTSGGLDFFLQHLSKKQKLKSSDLTVSASRENSQISEMGPALTSSIVLDPTKMQHTTVLTVATSFQKQIEQRVAKYKLENEQLHQKIDSIYKFVQETFAEAINVSEGDLPECTIDRLQVALKSLADSKNKDLVPLKIDRDLVSRYLLIADELEKEVNKSYRKLSVATQESFTIFVELHNWPTLLTRRDAEGSRLLCEVQQATSQCLTLTTLNDRISKLQEAQEKAKKIQQWYESCPSVIMQLQNCKDHTEYQWKALQKVVTWAVDETLDVLKEKPESADSAALYCSRLQNLDDRLVEAIDEWEKFKIELLNAVPELNNLFQKSS
ncbi:structural maintenance of chromosomes protein 6A isoform X1 [Cryptomeria japonica]|uniref:structural maintenance of chromosomes protein 6A isoform X1 n=2 Tax=Cryptomeria japonica TaxID=3369 RepID=UPI0027DA4C88|nr:structural maintenance of chromosomes protein 6A isoform X1 [Cryptomeria japonica]